MSSDINAFALIAGIAVLAPILADWSAPRLPVPLVVFEILLGLVLGPSVIGLGAHGELIDTLSDLGLATLMFLAGYEIDFARIAGAPLRRAAVGWLICLGLAIVVGLLVSDTTTTGVLIGAAMATTALGTILPIIRDAGELETPFGSVILAIGAVGEFGPIIAIALFLSGRSPFTSALVLIGFGLVTAFAIYRAASRREDTRMQQLVARTLRTSGQFAVRLLVFCMAAMVTLAVQLGLDMLLGAFTAGVIGRLMLSRVDEDLQEAVMSKLEAVGFGFLVPLFFINTGMDFDLDSLTSSVTALLLLPAFLGLFLLIRGLPTALLAQPGSSTKDRICLGLLSATQLPLVVAITTIGVENHELEPKTAAAMVGAGMLSVLVFPLVALRLRGGADSSVALPAEAW